uniref:CENP-T/Histone H4 histone fold domain-containing protein n=1 Tax=Amphiprion percula TaxID=161767 RepID=A0A3P8T2I8_AMPPE
MSSAAVVQRDLGETALSEGFTLGLSKLSEPDITTDIVNCNTALYDQPDAITSNFSIVATQDKPTVMASQLQRQMEQEEHVEVEQSNLGKTIYVFPSEEEGGDEVQSDKCGSESQSVEDVYGAVVQDPAVVLKSVEEDVAESQTDVTDDVTESEEEANRVEAQTKQEGSTDFHLEEDVEARSNSEKAEVAPDSQTEEEEDENATEAQTEDESAVDSQPEEDAEAGSSQAGDDEEAPDSQTEKEEEEENAAEAQTEDESAFDSQTVEDVEAGSSQAGEDEEAPDSQTEKKEEEEEEEDGEAQSQIEEGGALSQFEGDVEVESQSYRDEDEAESQNNNDDDGKQEEEEQTSEQLKGALEHIIRRTCRSEGALIVPVRKAGEDLANNTVAVHATVRCLIYVVVFTRTDKFFDRLVEDLETYAAHAKRKTIEVEDCILLLKRQGYVNNKVPVEVLIEKYLSMQQRKLLIPIATSGNVVIPKMRR